MIAALRQLIAKRIEKYKELDAFLAECDEDDTTIGLLLELHSELSATQLPGLPEGTSLPAAPSALEEIEKMTPTEAVRFFFDQKPKWTPKELATELKKMHQEGRLRIKEGSDPAHSMHNILSSLVKQDFLTKHQPQPKSQRSWYVKKEEGSEGDGSGSTG